MFNQVLLALTGCDAPAGSDGAYNRSAVGRPAARLAAALAARHGAALSVLAVCEPGSPDSADLARRSGCADPFGMVEATGAAGASAYSDVAAQARRSAEVEALLRELLPQGLRADVLARTGCARVEILRTLRLLEPDLLVLGQERPEAWSNVLRLASVEAPCPVLAAPAPGAQGADDRPAGPFERILTAVDLEDESVGARALLDFSARLAAREGAELTLLHVLPPPSGPYARDQRDAIRRAEAAASRLACLCQGLPGAKRFPLVARDGAPAGEILENANARKAELIVLAPGAKAGHDGVCARVLRQARAPVLLAGPPVLTGALFCPLAGQPDALADAAPGARSATPSKG